MSKNLLSSFPHGWSLKARDNTDNTKGRDRSRLLVSSLPQSWTTQSPVHSVSLANSQASIFSQPSLSASTRTSLWSGDDTASQKSFATQVTATPLQSDFLPVYKPEWTLEPSPSQSKQGRGPARLLTDGKDLNDQGSSELVATFISYSDAGALPSIASNNAVSEPEVASPHSTRDVSRQAGDIPIDLGVGYIGSAVSTGYSIQTGASSTSANEVFGVAGSIPSYGENEASTSSADYSRPTDRSSESTSDVSHPAGHIPEEHLYDEKGSTSYSAATGGSSRSASENIASRKAGDIPSYLNYGDEGSTYSAQHLGIQ